MLARAGCNELIKSAQLTPIWHRRKAQRAPPPGSPGALTWLTQLASMAPCASPSLAVSTHSEPSTRPSASALPEADSATEAGGRGGATRGGCLERGAPGVGAQRGVQRSARAYVRRTHHGSGAGPAGGGSSNQSGPCARPCPAAQRWRRRHASPAPGQAPTRKLGRSEPLLALLRALDLLRQVQAALLAQLPRGGRAGAGAAGGAPGYPPGLQVGPSHGRPRRPHPPLHARQPAPPAASGSWA